ncbi:hypothetical protein T440DRAFT_483832 [Plenodomus tracheiphilus IPT5]|uniref:Uncharacterized protein n=1 Tax=Plenodomus tracheiphilus IPT5 TaxID=1408161 RepID=A0A6A7ANR4_9PLEO|nr:hypothetical protein T440DRAFT_483832 [Plenodomus tracheiphilus IPT5]
MTGVTEGSGIEELFTVTNHVVCSLRVEGPNVVHDGSLGRLVVKFERSQCDVHTLSAKLRRASAMGKCATAIPARHQWWRYAAIPKGGRRASWSVVMNTMSCPMMARASAFSRDTMRENRRLVLNHFPCRSERSGNAQNIYCASFSPAYVQQPSSMKALPIAVIVLVTVNIVLVLVQVFRSWLPWEWEDSTSFALQRRPPARKLKLWPFLQASGYLIATVVTLAVWLGFSSDLALQCLLESCWLNSFFGQWLMLHKIFGDGDRAQLVYIGSGLNVGIDLVGFVLMQVPVANLQGRFLVLLSHAIFYFSSGIAINSIWLVDNLKTLRYAAFISVFAVTACGLVVNGLIFLRKDNSIFLFRYCMLLAAYLDSDETCWPPALTRWSPALTISSYPIND